MASASFEHVTKRFAEGESAENVMCLEVMDGQFLVILGPSGCGKSTALRMLAGVEDVTEGVIKIGDTVINNVPSRNRDVAMVFQTYALYPHMSVFDNMAFSLRLQGLTSRTSCGGSLARPKPLGLSPLLRRLPGQLSG